MMHSVSLLLTVDAMFGLPNKTADVVVQFETRLSLSSSLRIVQQCNSWLLCLHSIQSHLS